MKPVPPSAERIYRTWLAMFPESRQHATLDFFYSFVRTVLKSTRLRRDGMWLREILARDAPSLSAEAIDWYSERFDIILEYELAVPKHSQPLGLYVGDLAREHYEAFKRERGES